MEFTCFKVIFACVYTWESIQSMSNEKLQFKNKNKKMYVSFSDSREVENSFNSFLVSLDTYKIIIIIIIINIPFCVSSLFSL